MSSSPKFDDALREAIIQRPHVILDDHDLMHALFAANDRAMGSNIVDLRGVAMERLEHRLGRLEDTHRSVIAAAYENLAGTHQIHRAVLRLLEPATLEQFLDALSDDVARILRVDSVTLVMEREADDNIGDRTLLFAAPGEIDGYMGRDRAGGSEQVTLREVAHGSEPMHGDAADSIRSEACLRLDLGDGRRPALLVLGSQDGRMFSAQHGTDLLTFFAGVVERSLRRWLP
jgi:uncharacterized protein YigA (DUF484 family)